MNASGCSNADLSGASKAMSDPVSPIEGASNRLSATLSATSARLVELESQLSRILRSVPPETAPGAGNNQLAEAQQSEMHGFLLDATAHAEQNLRNIEALIRRITL